ncbi:hypothetical protein CR513_14818, partial [Mucuna pruriens]
MMWQQRSVDDDVAAKIAGVLFEEVLHEYKKSTYQRSSSAVFGDTVRMISQLSLSVITSSENCSAMLEIWHNQSWHLSPKLNLRPLYDVTGGPPLVEEVRQLHLTLKIILLEVDLVEECYVVGGNLENLVPHEQRVTIGVRYIILSTIEKIPNDVEDKGAQFFAAFLALTLLEGEPIMSDKR